MKLHYLYQIFSFNTLHLIYINLIIITTNTTGYALLTFLDMIECTVARPSRNIKINLACGNSSDRYAADLNVSGSLLHSRGAGSPCLAITSRQNAAMAESST
jgi:hypothetical protein